jgi:hypothetical protein
MVLFASLFWSGLAVLALTLLDRYTPALQPPSILSAFIAIVLSLTYAAHYIRRARKIAYLNGHAVEIGPKQHPDLHARLKAACKRLAIDVIPTVYLFQNPRLGDSFSLKFRATEYLALNAELIGALTERQGAIDFFIGFELGRLRDRYRRWIPFLFPATILPLLGPAYARACIYTYDRSGLEASKTGVDAAYALAVQISGTRRWKSLNIAQFAVQADNSRGFWMPVIELSSPVPWLSKRIAHMRARATQSDAFLPRRNPFAFLVALLIPYIAVTSRQGVWRAVIAVLWIVLAVVALIVARQQIQQYDLLDRWQSAWFGREARMELPAAVPRSRSTASTRKSPVLDKQRNPHAALDADLKLLGDVALQRFKKYGGIPCEVGKVDALNLYYRSERYAYSCSDPIVYTLVGAGEFDPGKAPYLRAYNWKESKFDENNPIENETSK